MREKKPGKRKAFHLGKFVADHVRAEAQRRGELLENVVAEIVTDYVSTLDTRNINFAQERQSVYLNVRIDPETDQMLNEICHITGSAPASVLNMILLWAYVTANP